MRKAVLFSVFAGSLLLSPAIGMAQEATTGDSNHNDCELSRQRAGLCENPNNAYMLSPDERQAFTAFIDRDGRIDALAPAGFELRVGAIIPGSVTFYEVPASAGVPGMARYRYVILDGRTALVDPADRRVVMILE